MNKEEITIYNLELNQSIIIESKPSTSGHNFNTRVTRVPGGWLYSQMASNYEGLALATSFVPFNSEFSEDYDEKGRKLGNREK